MNSSPNFPLKHSCPKFGDASVSGCVRIILLCLSICMSTTQPTGQPGQIVLTTLSAFSHLFFLSTKAPVGHTSMHAPQNSHPDSSKDVPCEVPIRLFPDLSRRVRASS